MHNIEKLQKMSPVQREELLKKFLREWTGIGPNCYVFDLNRSRACYDTGEVTVDDFDPWDEDQVEALAKDLLDWLWQTE